MSPKPLANILPTYLNRSTGQVFGVFTNDPGDRNSVPGQVIPKNQKMIIDASWLNTQHYKVWTKGKLEQSRERSSALL